MPFVRFCMVVQMVLYVTDSPLFLLFSSTYVLNITNFYTTFT